MILLEDGTRFYEALHWTIARYKSALSVTSLKKQNEAIGRFIDLHYWLNENAKATLSPETVLVKYREKRTLGCVELAWKPISPTSVGREIEYISSFYDYCTDAFEYEPINPMQRTPLIAASYKQKLAYIVRTARKRSSLLGYLKEQRPASVGGRVINNSSPRESNVHKAFPPHKVSDLVESCNSIRDVLVLLLLFYGGLRSSELCHLFVQDISPAPDTTGQAIVTVAHPIYGWINYYRSIDGRYVEREQRQTYLKEEYGRTPRNLLPTVDPLHAGWKGMTYDDKGYRSSVVWSRPDIGILFYRLHRKYMETRSRMRVNHPYYFVNTDTARSRENYGAPMKLKGLRDRFEDACRRIDLQPGRSSGINPHGARHFYGYFLANVLRLPKEMAQRFLRHAAPESTDIYYNLSLTTARYELSKAFNAVRESEDERLVRALNIAARKI